MEKTTSLAENLEAGVTSIDSRQLLSDPQRLDELNAHWSGLKYLGLELDFTENALLCNHRGNGFCFSIPYDQADSEELRRDLFSELRIAFGGFTDRYLAAIFQPSRQVGKLFDSFRAFLPLCRSINRLRFDN